MNSLLFNVPQDLCPGALAPVILIPLFVNSQKAVSEHNKSPDDVVLYRSRKPVSQVNDSEKMRDTGLISEQEYGLRKSKLPLGDQKRTQ